MAVPSTGHSMHLYRNTGTVAVPIWTLVDEVGDVSIPDFERGLAELKRRSSNYTKNLATLIQGISIEFRLHYGLDATNYDAIRTAFIAGTVVEWLILDQLVETSGSQGLRVPVIVQSFPWDQPLEDISGHDVRLAIAYMEEPAGTEIEPSWLTVG